jgi:hypothetical protein
MSPLNLPALRLAELAEQLRLELDVERLRRERPSSPPGRLTLKSNAESRLPHEHNYA